MIASCSGGARTAVSVVVCRPSVLPFALLPLYLQISFQTIPLNTSTCFFYLLSLLFRLPLFLDLVPQLPRLWRQMARELPRMTLLHQQDLKALVPNGNLVGLLLVCTLDAPARDGGVRKRG
jgi:predicted PurR-regulated permease PerM